MVRDDEGRPVGALLELVLQRLRARCVARSSASFLDVLQVMAPTQEPPLHLITVDVKHFRVCAEPLTPQELAVGDVLNDMAGVTGAVGEVGVGICGFGMDVRFEAHRSRQHWL